MLHWSFFTLAIIWFAGIVICLEDYQIILNTYDFDHDNQLDRHEFGQMFLSHFKREERRYVTPSVIRKLFHKLDMDNDTYLNSEEFRKIFDRWLLPVITPKTSMVVCVPSKIDRRMFSLTIEMIEQNQVKFPLETIYVTPCIPDQTNGDDLVDFYMKQMRNILLDRYGIRLRRANQHKEVLYNIDHDQLSLYRNVIDKNRGLFRQLSLDEVISNNSQNQVFDENVVREQARFKIDFALDLADELYRKYKQF